MRMMFGFRGVILPVMLAWGLTGCQWGGLVAPAPEATPVAEASPASTQPFERIAPEAFRNRQLAGEKFVIVDVRSASAFAAEHIEGAVNAPFGQIQAGKADLTKDEPLLLYCT
jgi:3-mercaptopyruvate sulfurtransferase SseA